MNLRSNLISKKEIKHCLILLIFFANPAYSEYISNLEISRVIDGDTIHAFDGKQLRKIRLIGIDAPEKDQPMGKESTDYLVELLSVGIITAEISERDRYNRDLGIIFINNRDINRLMVSSGMAWVYDDYVTDDTYYLDQNNAKNLKRGIWSNSNPISPWDWRRGKRNDAPFLSELGGIENSSPATNKICCKICKKGKACGDSCISRKYSCRKPPGCACDG